MKQMDRVMQLQMTLSKKLEREKQRAIKWAWLHVSHVTFPMIDLDTTATAGYRMLQ